MSAVRPFSEADVAAAFGDALRDAGFRLPGAPVMDGAWHRAAVEGDKGAKKSGRYRGYLNGVRPAGFIENFKDPARTGTWKFGADAPRLSEADRVAAERAMAASKAARARDTEARLERIAQESIAEWERSAPAPDDGVVQVRVTPKTKNPFTIKALSISGVTWKRHVLNHAPAAVIASWPRRRTGRASLTARSAGGICC